MARPQLLITKTTTVLSQTSAKDGVSLLVMNLPAGYTGITGSIFYNLPQAEAAGFTQAKDLTNNYLAWEHIKDFYAESPAGTELHVVTVPATTTFTNLFTVANAAYVLMQARLALYQGYIKLIGVALKPTTDTAGTGVSADIITAAPLAQAFANFEFSKLRPVDIILEGRLFSGTAAAATNLRSLLSGNVSVVVARDADRKATLTTAGNTGAANYAALGLALGTASAVHVGRNIGRVASGALPGVVNSEFSGGQKPYTDIDGDALDVLNDKGYIFMDKYLGASGWYWNDDHTCDLVTQSNAQLANNRVLNKMARIVIATYVQKLKDEVLTNAVTGKISAIEIATYQNLLQKAVVDEMINNPDITRVREISDAKVTLDPNQNVNATSKTVVKLSAVLLGINRTIQTQLELVNSL